jgi:predicted DNA binding CopG/RHH family protein
MKKKLIVPKFKNEDEESDWWAEVNLADYFDASDFVHFDPDTFMAQHGKLQTKRITIRVPAAWIAKAKERAAALDVPYQSLLKQFIQRGLEAK